MKHLSERLLLITLLASFLTVSCQFEDVNLDDTPQEYIDTLSSGAFMADGHECVDLGLSVKWATCNVGAYSEKYIGGYYSWAETEEKSEYTRYNYRYGIISIEEDWYITKYCADSLWGFNNFYDGKTVLDPEEDVARALWRGEWRMPTPREQQELVEKCTWKWAVTKDIRGRDMYGFVVTSNIDGYRDRFIFLPASGYRNGNRITGMGANGVYWSDRIYTDKVTISAFASTISFAAGKSVDKEKFYVSAENREIGASVRAVHP